MSFCDSVNPRFDDRIWGDGTRGAERALAPIPFFMEGVTPTTFSEASRVRSIASIESENPLLLRNFWTELAHPLIFSGAVGQPTYVFVPPPLDGCTDRVHAYFHVYGT